MTQAAIPAPPEAPTADTVPIELGPDTGLYPERLIQPEPTPEPTVPESDDTGDTEPTPTDAGPSEKGSRRAKGEDAYQRGLREGEEKARQAIDEQADQQRQEKAKADAVAHIEKLFADLESNDYDARENAGKELAGIVKGNKVQTFYSAQGRNAALAEIAESFKSIKDVEGVGEDGLTELWSAPTPADLARRAFEMGAKSAKTTADERIAELEAQLTEERGRRAGSSLTPERQNGSSGGGPRLTLDQYQRMSARDIRKAGISSADIDAMTAELAAEAARGR